MNKMLFTIALFCCLTSTVFSQQFGDSIAPTSVPSNTNVEVKVDTDAKFVSIKARKSLFEVVKVYEGDGGSRNRVLNATDLVKLQEEIKKQSRTYTFTGPDGRYLVEITQFDPVMGIKEEALTVIIGEVNPNPKPDPKPDPKPEPDTLEAQIQKALDVVSGTSQEKMISVRMPDGNTLQKKAVHAIGQQYGDIAREVTKNPNAWDIATMVDDSKTRIGGIIPSSEMSSWLGFFKELTTLQRELDTNDIDVWINFFKAVEKVLTEV